MNEVSVKHDNKPQLLPKVNIKPLTDTLKDGIIYL